MGSKFLAFLEYIFFYFITAMIVGSCFLYAKRNMRSVEDWLSVLGIGTLIIFSLYCCFKLFNNYKLNKARKITEFAIKSMWFQYGAETFETQDRIAMNMIREHFLQLTFAPVNKCLFALKVYSSLSNDIIKNPQSKKQLLEELITTAIKYRMINPEQAKNFINKNFPGLNNI